MGGHLLGGNALNSGDDGADGGGQVTEAKASQEGSNKTSNSGGGGLNSDEEEGAAGTLDAEEVTGLQAESGSLGGKVTNNGDLGDDGANGAGDEAQVDVREETLSLDDEVLAVLADDGEDVGGFGALGDGLNSGDDSTDGGGEVTQTETSEERSNKTSNRGGGGLNGDEKERTAGTLDAEELVGVQTESGSLGGKVTDNGDLSDDRADGAGDEAQVDIREETLSLDDEVLTALVNDGNDVAGLSALGVGSSVDDGALNSGDGSTDNGGDLTEAEARQKAGEEALDLAGEGDKSELTRGQGDGDEVGASVGGRQAGESGSSLDDSADGLGGRAQVETGELLGEAGLKLNEQVLGLVQVGDSQDAVDHVGDTAGAGQGGGDGVGWSGHSTGNGTHQGGKGESSLHCDCRE